MKQKKVSVRNREKQDVLFHVKCKVLTKIDKNIYSATDKISLNHLNFLEIFLRSQSWNAFCVYNVLRGIIFISSAVNFDLIA